MKELFWKLVAWIVSRPRIADWIIAVAMRTPYWHLQGYMDRYWLFNGYDRNYKKRKYPWLKMSIRVHRILRRDNDRVDHNHPFDARTIILKKWYVEERNGISVTRCVGDTATILKDDFHRITKVPAMGTWTMFIIFKDYGSGEWGFKTPAGFVRASEYISEQENNNG